MSNELVDKGEIDLVRYGQLWEKVNTLDKKIDQMEKQVTELLELANRGKGAFWVGMTLASFIGGMAGFFSHMFTGK